MKYLRAVTNESRMRSSPCQQVDLDLFEWKFDNFYSINFKELIVTVPKISSIQE